MSSSNNVVGGLGRNLIVGGLAGNGLPSISTGLFQNQDFEVPDSDPGEAANWTTEQVYSEIEYASFTRPGLSIVVTTIPAEQPTLGFTFVHQTDGTISILQAATEEDAAEDFEEGWDNNEQFLMALPDNAVTYTAFENSRDESFDSGWANDPELLDNFTEIISAFATFSVHTNPLTGLPITNQFENFEGYWPAAATQPYTTEIPNIIFGTCTPTTLSDPGAFTVQDRIITTDENGFNQYVDILVAQITTVPKTSFTITIHYLDRDEHAQTTPLIIAQDTPIGAYIPISGTNNTFLRYIDTVDPDGTNGFPGLIFFGDPGVLFDSSGNIQATWIRAEFS